MIIDEVKLTGVYKAHRGALANMSNNSRLTGRMLAGDGEGEVALKGFFCYACWCTIHVFR